MSLRHALLGLIELEPGTGYDLVQRIRHSIGFFWPATHQQIYRELHHLSGYGFLQETTENQTHRPDRRVYSITSSGLNELDAWLSLDSPPAKIRDPFLLRLFAAHRLSDKIRVKHIESQKDIHTQTYNLYHKIANNMSSWPQERQHRYRFARHTLQLGIYFEEAWLRWCQELMDL